MVTKEMIKQLMDNCTSFQEINHAIARDTAEAHKKYLDTQRAMTRWFGFA